MKFLIEKYYYLLAFVILFFLFNVLIRDKILGKIFGTSSDTSITNANAYGKETIVRNILIYLMLASLIFIGTVSISLLVKGDTGISKFILIGAVLLIGIFFLGLISIGGFC